MSQQQHGSTGGPLAGQRVSGSQILRSDATKPAPRSTSTSRASSVSSSSTARPGSASQQTGSGAAVRAGRPSLGTAAGSFTSSRQASATAAHGSASVLTASAGAAADRAAAAVYQGMRQAGSAAAAAAAAVPATTAPKGDANHTPVPPAAISRFNPVYNDDSLRSNTPSVNTKAYSAKLSPQIAELERQVSQQPEQQAAGSSSEASTAPWAAAPQGIDPGSGSTSTAIRSGRYAPAKAAPPAGVVPVKPPKPQHYLRTTGDLFTLPGQDPQEPCVVGVTSTTQLVSPGWNQHRAWLTGSWVMQRPPAFLQEAGAGPGQEQVPPLMALPGDDDSGTAEYLLVDDLLTVMMGQAGQYIKVQLVEGEVYQRLGLWVQGAPNASLQEQVERLLPLCEYVHVIKRFVETRSQIQYPMVVQALAAAVRKLQEEWWVLVVQLEHQLKLGQLNLAALLYYCQAPSASLALLADIAGEASAKAELTSASLLNLLVARQRSLAGDRAGQQLVGQLLEAAAEPYFGILRQWMCSGVLDDPYGEFMVKEDADVRGDSLTPEGDAAFWSMRYTIRRGVTDEFDVPVFLESSSEAILVTGKYLNVIRACGQPVPPCPDSTLAQLRYDAAAAERGSPPFLAGIQAALSAAAGALLAHMCGPQGRLLSWLHCLKHFFLLDQGDFLVHLMEVGEGDASTPLAALAPHQLQGLLESALRASSLAASPHVDVVGDGALAIRMDKRSILQLVTAATVSNSSSRGAQQELLRAAGAAGGVSGWEDLMLSLNTSWPLNLVVGRRQLLHYQVLFKQLLSLKHAEKQLGYVWQALRSTKRLGKEDQALFRPWHLLCSQLQNVVVEVLRYTSIDVLEPLWCDMYGRLVQAGNMDEVIQLHNAFLAAALECSLLMQAEVVQHIHNLLAAAKELSRVVESCSVQQSGTSGGGSASLKVRSTTPHHLQVLSQFCRQATRQQQLTDLQRKVTQELEALLTGLERHYKALSQAPLGPAAGSSFRAAGRPVVGGGQRWSASSVAAVGDSSRELASLHNLIERLKLGEPSFEVLVAGY